MVAHLNIHTTYDLLNSSLRIKDVVAKGAKSGYDALAITDTNVLYGFPQFYDACMEAGVQPIFGMTTQVTDGLNAIETVLLARNDNGLKALYRISSNIQFNHGEDLSYDTLLEFKDDLIVIFKHADENVKTIIGQFQHQEGVYVSHDSSSTFDLPLVWMHASHYLDSEDLDTIPALHAIRDNRKLDLVNESPDLKQHFPTLQELNALNLPDDVWDNMREIEQACHAELNYHQSLLPKFDTPDESDSKTYLWNILQARMREWKLDDSEYQQRLKHEYDIITDMGFEDYFLIVSDLIHFAKTHDVMVGPGRGSSAGSLVSYLLGITTVDPIRYNLLFERFLNPERVTMPDIDIDFEDTKRDKVIKYVQDKYGEHHVAGIVTFGHLQARAVARDVGRIMGFDDVTLNEISTLIPHKLGITLDQAYQEEVFQKFVHRNYRHEKWYEICKKLEGLPRHTSTHAAGIIINDYPLDTYVPLTTGDDELLTQWTMTEAERIGLLKIDFLGLRNLSIIHQIIKQVKYHLNVDIDIETIPFDDKAVFQLLSRGDTTGIFQLESEGIRNVLTKLQPEHFEDIVAVTSLYRPGPMEEIPTYITRRHDPSKVTYLHPDLEPILKNTYGVIIYQEQIMQIASEFANFNYGEADILRRAMSKKNRAVLESERHHFIEGAKANGYDELVSKQIFDLILKFADYGFARAHAVSYSKIAYIMAYLKVHYSNYFYANILSNVIGSSQKTQLILKEAKHQQLVILPPNINHSHWFYKATKKGIYLSLGTIKGIGYQSVKLIIEERQKNGYFKDFFDFTRRIPNRIKTRKLLEALILVGAFDTFKVNRASLLSSIDQVLDEASDIEQDGFIFESLTPKATYKEKEEFPDQLLSEYEREYLGFYVSKHPVEKEFEKKQYLGVFQLANSRDFKPIFAQIDSIKRIRTKNGQNMAFVTINDGTTTMDGVIFPDQFKRYELMLKTDEMRIIAGKFEQRNNKTQLIIKTMMTVEAFEDYKMRHCTKIVIRKQLEADQNKAQLNSDRGSSSVPVYYYESASQRMSLLGFIPRDKESILNFIRLFSPRDIRIL